MYENGSVLGISVVFVLAVTMCGICVLFIDGWHNVLSNLNNMVANEYICECFVARFLHV